MLELARPRRAPSLAPRSASAISASILWATLLFAAACRHAAPATLAVIPSMTGDEHVALPPPPQVGALTPMLSAPRDTGAEAHVTIDTHGAEIDVRPLLAFLAEKGRMSLVYSPDVNRKIRVQLVDVPVSEALTAVLSLAGLTLEGSGPQPRAAVPSVVFYQLPINVDSLSVDAIMKRFRVGRSIAELLVQARTSVP